MSYIEYNPKAFPLRTVPQRPVPPPFLTIHHYGVFAFNRSAQELLGMLPDEKNEVVFIQAEAPDNNWYLRIVKTGGFELRPLHATYNDGTRRLGFYSRPLMRHILNISTNPRKGTQFFLSQSPVDLGDGTLAYLMQLTAPES